MLKIENFILTGACSKRGTSHNDKVHKQDNKSKQELGQEKGKREGRQIKTANIFVIFLKHFRSGGDENERQMANKVNTRRSSWPSQMDGSERNIKL